jgi:hypothetical protein
VYMGSRLASLARSHRSVKVQCPRCNVGVMMNVKDPK